MGSLAEVHNKLEIGVRYEFECWGPMLVQTNAGLDIEICNPITNEVEFRCKQEPGDIFEVHKSHFENYLHMFPVEVIRESELKWADGFNNLVVTEGRNLLLDTTLDDTAPSAGLSWYVGLKDTGSPAAADVMASHAGWSELSAIYSEGTRPAFTGGSAASGSIDNSASKAAFSITSGDDVYGAFLCNENTKGGTDGKLYGAGDFSSARSVINGDTLNVTVTCTIAAA